MYKNGRRTMAWVAQIDEVASIPKADAICAYRIGGWWVVDKKDAYIVGDLCVYVSIDSWVPHELAPFLSKGSAPREFNSVQGERLRTVKLRGQVSQGLLLPMDVIPQAHGVTYYPPDSYQEGTDVTDELKIQKWEAPVPAQLSGEVVGEFPSFIPKTDQERIQNLTAELEVWSAKSFTWEVSEKLDGSSMTVYFKDGKFGVCSRNWELKETVGNTFWRVARKHNLEDLLREGGRNIALQGELVGEGIQGNPYKLTGHDFFIYDIYIIDTQEFMKPTNRRAFTRSRGLQHVPLISAQHVIVETFDQLLNHAEGKSEICSTTEREGLVYKCNEFESSFKAISNKFLLGSNS